ncbi:MAG TPA: bifunctional demethylmenaquinone methyltransferase/2-methoxy-6-polyprenyl-1,4-benzoquinol methylase UbiE [Planctomycetaceae bacterium]|nr:bifunctional demethylmenaquinone methyltransferase/2-methoxy-6-polyprenyl-1,4-benzoquinol methylase UbiE [Planctomycetaceae bacterium]
MTSASDPQLSTLNAQLTDKSDKRIREMFGEISPRYDFLNHFLSGGTDIYWRWRTVRAVPPAGEAPILDVCTGTGDLALAYWKKARRRVSVVGTDFTPQMLVLAGQKHARRNRGAAAGAPVVFLGADTQRLPFADGTFQIVSVAFGLRNVSDTDRGLREMVRVCRPGGRVAVLEFSMPGNRLIRAGYRFYFRHVLPRIGQWLARNRQSAYNYLPESVEHFPQGAALAARMEQAGLAAITWTPLTFGVATLYVGAKARGYGHELSTRDEDSATGG